MAGGAPSFSRSLRKGGDFFRGVEWNLLSYTCHSESALAVRNLLLRKPPGVPFVILRKRSPSPREGLPTKDLCIPAASEAETASLILPKGKRRETPSVSPP